jgi:hypothetical protein
MFTFFSITLFWLGWLVMHYADRISQSREMEMTMTLIGTAISTFGGMALFVYTIN